MHEGLNLLKPYSYWETQSGDEVSYRFSTTTSVEYSCYFLDASGYFENYPAIARNVVTFGFRVVQPTPFVRPQYDIRIRDTIFDILYKSTLLHPERSIFIMFDTRDRRPRHRKVVFGKWFKEFCAISNLRITRLSLTIPSDDDYSNVHICLFVPSSSPDLISIKHAFIDIRDELISKGYPPSTDYQCKE